MNYYDPISYMVPSEEEGWLLKTILQKRMSLSRRLISRLKMTERGIMVNGERRYTNTRVCAGDLVDVRMAEEESEDILPEPIPFDIIHEDEFLLVVNKAAGMIVHPTHGHYTRTLANGVVHYWRKRGESYRFRPVHRLDQETTGVLAIAKNPFVHQHISTQMIAGGVEKEYIALVYGCIEEPAGTINAPIDRSPENPHLRIVTESGYPAVTHFVTMQRYAGATMVRLRLETGRTHQIRVHMRHLGHPLIGDKLYAPEYAMSPLQLERHALHAARLGLIHPARGCRVDFTAELPADMSGLAERLEIE